MTLADLLSRYPPPWHIMVDQGGCSLWPAVGDDDTFIASGLSDVEAERIIGVVNGLNERVRRLEGALRFLAVRVVPVVDHACAECHGSIPEEGFQCAYHLAKALAPGGEGGG